MDDLQLKQLFENQEIPAPNDNRRKEALNLAVAAFAAKKNEKSSQGTSFLARLIFRHPTDRSDEMSLSKKKLVYGGLATACVALLVYGVTLSGHRSVEEDVRQAESPLQVANVANDAKIAVLERKDESVVVAETEPPAPAELKKDKGANAPMDALKAAPQRALAVGPTADSGVAEGVSGSSMEADVSSRIAASPVPVPMPEQISPNYATQQEFGRDRFKDFEQNAVKQVTQEPVSTFSIDVDTASYAFARSSLDQGVLPQVDSIRVEEMVNYFDYAYPAPASREEPFRASVIVKPSPWHPGRELVTIGIKGYDVEKTSAPDSNLVFLLDVSGSMNEPNKLPLVKQSLSMLLDTLKPSDKISIVVYAGAAGTVLPPTPVAEKNTILMALQNLQPGGSTAGAEGIRQAYQLAESNFNKNAVNRVILATDGDFNVGITDPDELQDFVERKRESGIFLSVLGFGRGNYNDDMMQLLAQNGNGVAAYIDTLNEARKVLVQEAGSTLFPIAKDVKIQVEFNPAAVSEYRLVGYETRALNTEDFNNDKVDAGDIGAGAEVTAIYEVTPAGAAKAVDDSRYAPKAEVKPTAAANELAFVKVRYKLPDASESRLITTPVMKDASGDEQLRRETDWAVAVASFGQLLKGGKYTGSMTYDDVLKLADASKGADPFGYRAEFINLIYKAKTAAAMQTPPYPQPTAPGVIIRGPVTFTQPGQ